MDMFKLFGAAWYKNTVCIASRTELRPLKENDKLLKPTLEDAHGHVRLISAAALMKTMP